MESIVFYSYILIVCGFLMLVGAFIGLAYSKKEELELIKIFQDQSFTLSDRFIQPFRMHQNGEILIELNSRITNNETGNGVPLFNVYLTDLYANVGMEYSYGPRYLELSQLGQTSKTLDLKIGEYNLRTEQQMLIKQKEREQEIPHMYV